MTLFKDIDLLIYLSKIKYLYFMVIELNALNSLTKLKKLNKIEIHRDYDSNNEENYFHIDYGHRTSLFD